MKLEMIGSLATGFFAVAGTLFAQHGTSWPAVVAALVGALLAVLEMENLRLRSGIVVLVFNAVIGALGGPILMRVLRQWAASEEAPTTVGRVLEVSPNGVFLLIAFGVAYVAHDATKPLKAAVLDKLVRRIKGAAK